MPRSASKREVRNVKDPPVRHFGTIFFNDNDIYVGEYILGKRNSKVRDGWGVELRHHGERYEGEWRNGFREGLGVLTCANSQRAPPLKLSEDLQPGQPCKDFIGAERYTGHFKRGVRHGIGISVTSCGTLMREAWRRQARPGRVKPQLLQRTPLFLYSEKSDKEKTSEERKRDKLRKIERSRISRILEWSVREVQFFSACLGIGPATQSKIDTHQIDGDAFLSIISPDSADLVKDLFPLEEGSKTGTSSCGIWPQRPDVSARHRILIATVDFFHRALHKLSEPQPTEKDLNDQFPSLNIPKADLQLTGYVGEGGFGRVYSGIYKGARVAAKSTEGTRESRERKEILYIDPGPRRVPISFWNEISILKKLQHPNVPALLGYSLPDHVIVMELVPGQSLHDVLHSRKRTTYLSIYRESDFRYQDIVHVSKEICSGMAYIHAQNIVHCDVKTQNILVSGHRPAQDATSCWGTWSCWSGGLRDSPPLGVKICDFGFASILDGYKDEEPEDFYKKTIHVGCLGTYHYMAPEVFRAEGYSKASDVYSFGMVLWEMITRRVPFKDYTAFQVMAEVGYARKLPQPPDVCPFSLQKLLYSALRIEPAERQDFSTLAETCAQLESPKGIELEAMFWYWLAAI